MKPENNKFVSSNRFPDNVPNISELAQAYRNAVEASDLRMAQVAEAAALHIAVAEASIAEASVMRDFCAGLR